MHEQFRQTLLFKVIVNEEDHHSLWLIDREDPPGWHDTGEVRGSAMECLAYISDWYSRELEPESKAIPSSVDQAEPAVVAACA